MGTGMGMDIGGMGTETGWGQEWVQGWEWEWIQDGEQG